MGDITRRKELRRNVRRTLGTSSDPAPSTREVLDAARDLAAMLDLASGHAYGLAVYDFKTKEHRPFGDVLGELAAVDTARRLRREVEAGTRTAEDAERQLAAIGYRRDRFGFLERVS